MRLYDALNRNTLPESWLGAVAWRAVREFVTAAHDLTGAFLTLASVATIGVVVARAVASARVREGRPDPIARLRSRPRLQRWIVNIPGVLLMLPSLLWMLSLAGQLRAGDSLHNLAHWLSESLGGLLGSAGIAGLVYVTTRAELRALLAPVGVDRDPPREAGEIVFSAVAVTARTRAVVASFAAATVAMVGLTLTGPGDPRFGWALAAYVLTALGAPLFFQRASRIAVGLDGVWVRDASRTRFFAYRDLDEARPHGADLELATAGRAVLRLQMHGDDAGRRDEVLARIKGAITRARETTSRAAALAVQVMPARHLASSARGAEGYRVASVSRDQLWAVVEGQASDAETRTAAAEVLALQLDSADRVRLRGVAAQCAEPRLRVALAALASDADGEAVVDELDPGPSERRGVRGRASLRE
jgi:hypothetical protein